MEQQPYGEQHSSNRETHERGEGAGRWDDPFEAEGKKLGIDIETEWLRFAGGAPGPRPQYGSLYYAGYVRDPDGLHVEFVSGTR